MSDQKGRKLEAAVKEAGRLDLTPDRIVDLYAEISVMSYYLATTVADAYRKYSNAEGDRKAYMARHVIEIQADGTSNAKATAQVEGSNVYQALRAAEVDADADYQRWKLTFQGVQNVLSSLQMRSAMARDERKRTETAQTVRH